MMQSLLIGECFGMVSFGTIFGLTGLFSGVGSAFGPLIAGVIFDATHDYGIAFTIFAAASLLAVVTVFFAKPLVPVAVPGQEGPIPAPQALRSEKKLTARDGPFCSSCIAVHSRPFGRCPVSVTY